MPAHDWTQVDAGVFHAFHNGWITYLQDALNDGLLPEGFYALGEQRAGNFGPDVLTLEFESPSEDWESNRWDNADEIGGTLLLADVRPKTRFEMECEVDDVFYASKQRTITVRQSKDDRVVAIIEIVSSSNKRNRPALMTLIDEVLTSLQEGVSVMLLDLYPPPMFAPQGIHGVIWDYMQRASDQRYVHPAEDPLALVSYVADNPVRSFIEPLAVGSTLQEMPLFLTSERYINVPLEETYMSAYRGVPQRFKSLLKQA